MKPQPISRVAVATMLVALAALALATSAAAAPVEPPPPTGQTETIYVVAGREGLRFLVPPAVHSGDQLRIVNRTDPRQIGPVTFSLLAAGLVPRTPAARRRCFAAGHVCKAIATWHGAVGNGPPATDLVEAGAAGWDAEGRIGRRGDSWFSGYERGASVEQEVTAAPGTTLHFLDAFHPSVHGVVKVEAAPIGS